MAAIDLVTNARARVALPSAAASGSDDSAINTLITACSRAIMRYCHRAFVKDTYDELYDGRGERQLFLRNFPIQSVQSVRYRPVTVMKLTRTDSATPTPQARVEVIGPTPGLRLTRVTNGVQTQTTTGLTFTANVTISALGAAVNAADDGKWSWASTGYDTWPSGDLYCPNGSTTDPSAGERAGQGALQCVAGSFAELKMHTYELQGYQINARQGGLLRAIPYTDPELLHPEDLIFPIGINNFRVQYTAGYNTVPEDVQEACCQLIAYHFRLGPRETPDVFIPQAITDLLKPYRAQTLLMPGG
jgi:hypothetical protein